MKKIFLVLFLIVFSVIASSKFYVFGDSAEEEIKLYLGEDRLIPVSNLTRIAIGNPNIADVTAASRDQITLTPKAPGATSLIFWDNFGEQSLRVRVFPENIEEVKRRIDGILEKLKEHGVYTQPQEEEGRVMLMGRVKTNQEREQIITALGSLKNKIIDLIEIKEDESVVEIDVQVLELNKGATNTLGFTWPGDMTITEASLPTTLVGKFADLFTVNKFSRAAFTFKLDALIQQGDARILSRPRIICQSGKEAELIVGGEKPIMTTTIAATTGAQGTQVSYKEYGIKLKVKPTIKDDTQIKLGVNVEVSELSDTAVTLGSISNVTARAYPMTKRNASTELFLNDGQTMSIGGLIKQKKEDDVRKVPWLADLPVLGAFFRQRATKTGSGYSTKGDTELFITLTPRIVKAENQVKQTQRETTPQATTSVIAKESEVGLSNPFTGYVQLIQQRISENLAYPPSAKNAGFEGVVKLNLRLAYNGELLGAVVKNSSGYQILDEQAIVVAKSIAFYPPFPASIEQKELWVEVPVVYQLN